MIRITGGEFRGRMIKTPGGTQTRPTQARLRQALFNSIQTLVPDARVLDLFAGSGGLGIEALSRGAAHVTFVEASRPAGLLISANLKDLKVDSQTHSRLLIDDVEHALPQLLKLAPFDLVLADPPYEGGWELKLLGEFPWDRLLSRGGCLCLEWGSQKSQAKELPERTAHLVKVREKNYGDSILTTYYAAENQDPSS